MPDLPLSSHIAGAEYDPATRSMTVTFRSGAVYDYDNVPPEVYDGLMQADSPGGYLHENVRDAFNYRRREQS